jgi:hypothetical protein
LRLQLGGTHDDFCQRRCAYRGATQGARRIGEKFVATPGYLGILAAAVAIRAMKILSHDFRSG